MNVGTTAGTLAAGDDSRFTLADVVVAGTNTKITYDAKGRVTAGAALIAADIPSLSATYLPLAGGTMTGAVISAAGTAAAPSIGVGQATSGLYRGGVNIL